MKHVRIPGARRSIILAGAALGLVLASGSAAVRQPERAGQAASLGGPGANPRQRVMMKARDQSAIRAAVARGDLLPLPHILALAQARVPGDVIEVELERERWGFKYEVTILTPNGRVREVELNARNGALLEIEDN